MGSGKFGRSVWGAIAVISLAACSSPAQRVATDATAASTSTSGEAPEVAATTATANSAAPATTATPAPSTTAKPTTTTTPKPRSVMNTNFGPFAHTEGVVLHYPSQFVERVGFHQSTKAGARTLGVLPTAGDVVDLPSRKRGTNDRTAADILAEPSSEIRSPVSGRVLRGGTYTLYCKYTDSYLVIEPDARPGWEVKLLHITGLTIAAGQRVEAGVTPIAAHPTRLPFRSQVEDYSTDPVWPHVHIEVVDPNIKNPPGVGGGGCS